MKKYTLADYAFQFITVTAGVLIALFIDGLAETRNNRELVATARQTIAREIADNQKELSGLSNSIAAANRNVDNGLQLANDLLSKGKSDVHSVSIGFNLATLNDSSWLSADRTGAVAHMSYEEVKKYSELYALQELFETQQRKAVDLVSAGSALIAGSFDPDNANKDDLARFRDQLMLLRANLFVIEQLGLQLLEAYGKFQPGK
jgi:hypothetical protein